MFRLGLCDTRAKVAYANVCKLTPFLPQFKDKISGSLLIINIEKKIVGNTNLKFPKLSTYICI